MAPHLRIRPLEIMVLALGMAIAGGCRAPSAGPSGGDNRDPNRTLARIGNEDFSAAQFEVYLQERFPESTSPLPRNDGVLSGLLDRAIDERLLLQAARHRQVTASDQDVQEFLANSALVPGSNQDKTLHTGNERRFEQARDNLIINRYLQSMGPLRSNPSLSEEKKYYESHLGFFQEPERYHVAEILVKDEPLARAIEGMLAKKKSFESLARKYSRNELASKGGDLGWFGRGELPEQLEKVVMGLKPEQHSGVVQTDFGFHIFKLKAIRPGRVVPFGESRQRIQTLLASERRKEALAQEIARLRTATAIVIQFQNLGFKYSPERGGG
ncbi:MAG: peptidylprolyl isomerase [Acidobacteriia bacterium]|nr:peptidylprolyl isomerase [Terriglobia bacterium]